MNYLFSNKDLKKLIIPLILEQTLSVTVGMVDTMMISSVGEVAVSGVSLVNMLNNLVFAVLSAMATGGAVIVSQNIGAGNIKQARNAAKQLLAVVLFISTGFACLAFLLRKGLLRLFFGSIEADVMEACLIYFAITALSFPCQGIYNSCAALFRSMGKTHVTFKVSVIGNIINVVGNALGIFVFKLGVAGVAIPTLISHLVTGIILYILLHNPAHLIHFEKEHFRLSWQIIKNILYIAIPSGIENGIFSLGRVVVVSIISGFGTIQIAANGVAGSLDSIGCIAGQAMNLAMITVIGRCVGAKDQAQIKYYTKKLLFIAYAIFALINIPLLSNLHHILAIYHLEPATTELAYKLVMIHNGMAMFLWPLSFVLPNMLRACNDVRYPMVISVFSMCVFRVGFSFIIGAQLGLGAIGVWIAMVLDWTFRVICFVGRYLHGNWKETMYRLKS